MAKIFLTGMTAPQASRRNNSRTLSFAGVLDKVLTEAGHEVTWEDPTFEIFDHHLDEYDCVLVGVGPLTSLASNRVYGALRIIDMLWKDPKLKLFIDAPGTNQIPVSIKAIHTNPKNLVKSFYSYRKGFEHVVTNQAMQDRLRSAISRLNNEQWPTTIYPSLPWTSQDQVKSSLPSIIGDSLVGVNLDSHLISNDLLFVEKSEKWCADDLKHRETKKLISMLSLPISPLRWSKGNNDVHVFDQISKSACALVSVVKGDKTWWTYRYIQALNASTPVYTDWITTSLIGPAWSHLAPTIEAMPPEQRLKLSISQKLEYLNSIPEKQEALNSLENLLNLSKKEGNQW
jgi:hypothetical protein